MSADDYLENLPFLELCGRTKSVFNILKEFNLDTFKHVEGYENTGNDIKHITCSWNFQALSLLTIYQVNLSGRESKHHTSCPEMILDHNKFAVLDRTLDLVTSANISLQIVMF